MEDGSDAHGCLGSGTTRTPYIPQVRVHWREVAEVGVAEIRHPTFLNSMHHCGAVLASCQTPGSSERVAAQTRSFPPGACKLLREISATTHDCQS